MALPATGLRRPKEGEVERTGSSAVCVAAPAVAATLLALAIFVWGTWRGDDPAVTVDLPPASAATTSGRAARPVDVAVEADPPVATVPDDDTGGEVEAAAPIVDPAFFEAPMRVIRRSNIRVRPTPDSAAIGRAEEGTMVILVEPKPERGYFRIATGELEGWIWGANLIAADPTQQPDPAELPGGAAAPDGAEDEPAGAPPRR